MVKNLTGLDSCGKLYIATTEKGKEIYAKVLPNSTLMAVEFNSGGELPSELQTSFVNYSQARAAVELYLASKKVKSNAKTNES